LNFEMNRKSRAPTSCRRPAVFSCLVDKHLLGAFPSAYDVDARRQGYRRLARGSAEVADERARHIIYMYRFGTSEREVKHRAGCVDARLGKRGVGHGAFGNLLEL